MKFKDRSFRGYTPKRITDLPRGWKIEKSDLYLPNLREDLVIVNPKVSFINRLYIFFMYGVSKNYNHYNALYNDEGTHFRIEVNNKEIYINKKYMIIEKDKNLINLLDQI